VLNFSLKKPVNWAAILLLLIFFGRLVNTAAVKSITYDEIKHVFQGALYWEGDDLYSVVQNPPLVNGIIGIPVSLGFDLKLPDSSQFDNNWLEVSQAFMWELNGNGLEILWAGRLSIMLLSLLLGALIYRWAGQLFTSTLAGLVALLLYTFDPNILAHSFLATTDIGLAFFLTLAAYLAWRYWRNPDKPNWSLYLVTGLAIGLALAAKFSGLIILPALVLIAGYRWMASHTRLSTLKGKQTPRMSPFWTVLELFGWLLVAGLVLLLIYRFNLDILKMDFAWQRAHQLNGHSAYFWGELGRDGWPLYFPTAFAIKTPIPVLILLLIVFLLFFSRRGLDWERLWPLIIVAGFFGAGILSRVNVGYRYLLPVLPLLYVLVAQLGQPSYLRSRYARAGVAAALALTVIVSLWAHPHYLAYFNQLAGGPDNGWKFLADSNIDWGQDLQALSEYLERNDIASPNISWFGTATLEAYGIKGDLIPAHEFTLEDPFYPELPSSGTYVISVTQLLGVYLDNPDRFHWFQAKEPKDKVGYSLFVYNVPADGQTVGLALSGIGIASIELEDYEKAFKGNDVRPRWYDARTSFVWPGGQSEAVWAAVGDGHWPEHPALANMYPSGGGSVRGQNEKGLRYHLIELGGSPIISRQNLASGDNSSSYDDSAFKPEGSMPLEQGKVNLLPLSGVAVFGDSLGMLGYQLLSPVPLKSGGDLELLTAWRVHQTPEGQLKIFVHLFDSTGNMVAQDDTLDVRMEGLVAGDEIAQLHTLHLPAELPAGKYSLQIGLYDEETLERLLVPVGNGALVDKLVLDPVIVEKDETFDN
jgi:hypothetical protein